MQLSAVSGTTVPSPQLWALATRSVTAWCEHNPVEVAACFEDHGQQSANHKPPVVGREALEATTYEIMQKFPDIAVHLDGLKVAGERAFYEWTLTGINATNGTPLHLSGLEVWIMGPSGLIENSHSWYDESSIAAHK